MINTNVLHIISLSAVTALDQQLIQRCDGLKFIGELSPRRIRPFEDGNIDWQAAGAGLASHVL